MDKRNRLDKSLGSYIAWFYYEKEWPQYRIAKEFGLSKALVSRILKQAKSEKIVDIKIHFPFDRDEEIEQEIVRKYKLRSAYVVDGDETDILDLIGKAAAFITNISINDGDIIGLSVGRTVARMIRHIGYRNAPTVSIVQLIGGFGKVVEYDPCSLVHEMCRKMKAQGTYYNSLAIVRDKTTQKISKSDPCVDLWTKCNKAIFGIGPTERSILVSSGLIKKEEMDEIVEAGGIGDILGHYFNSDGKVVVTEIDKWLESIPLEILMAIPERIAVAGGDEKVEAITGVLLSGYVNTFITDKKTASALI